MRKAAARTLSGAKKKCARPKPCAEAWPSILPSTPNLAMYDFKTQLRMLGPRHIGFATSLGGMGQRSICAAANPRPRLSKWVDAVDKVSYGAGMPVDWGYVRPVLVLFVRPLGPQPIHPAT